MGSEPTSIDHVNQLLKDQRDALKARFENIRATILSLSPIQSQQKVQLELQHVSLAAQKEDLDNQLASLKRKEQNLNKAFQDTVYYKPPPGTGAVTTLQDFALAIFAVGWFLLGAVIVAVSTFQADGTWRRGLLTAILLTIITMVIYSILNIYL